MTLRPRSLRTQLILWNVIVLALLVALMGGILRWTARSYLISSVHQQLDREAMAGGPPGPPMRRMPPPPGRPFDERRPPPPQRLDREHPYRPHLFDSSGQSLHPNDTRPPWDPEGLRQAIAGTRSYRTVVNQQGVPLEVLSAPRPPDGEVVQVAYDLTDVNRALAGLDRALLTLLPLGLLAAAGSGAMLTDRVLRRVRSATQAARLISAKDLSGRLPVSGADEFSELALTINKLLDRLQTAFRHQELTLEQQRRFTADASHELKTPLTVIKGTASLALATTPAASPEAQSFHEIDQAASVMSRLVQDLLLLARADAGQLGRERSPVPLNELFERAIASTPGASGRVAFMRADDDSLSVSGNEWELLRVFTNLLANAMQYTPLEGQISVVITAGDEKARVVITDTGIGIAPEHLPHLGERFYRVDTSRTRPTGGTGLGLSICRGILTAHQGTLAIESTLGIGTCVTVELPRA